jgi:uncharacterized protein (DUF2267 family)
MSNNNPTIDRTVEKTTSWLVELDDRLGGIGQAAALRVLRAVLHALRDRSTPDVAADFAAQLPTLLRGFFYDRYKPSRTPIKYGRDDFLDYVAEEALLAGPTEAATSVEAVTRDITDTTFLWRGHVSADGGTTWHYEQEMRARRRGN